MSVIRTYSDGSEVKMLTKEDVSDLLGKQMFAKYRITLTQKVAYIVITFDNHAGFFYKDLEARFRSCGLSSCLAAFEISPDSCAICNYYCKRKVLF